MQNVVKLMNKRPDETIEHLILFYEFSRGDRFGLPLRYKLEYKDSISFAE